MAIKLVASLVVCLALQGLAIAQDTDASADEVPELPATDVIAEPAEATATDIELPSQDLSPFDSSFDLPFSYPSLEGEVIEGLDGATRGDISLFELPSLGTIIGRREMDEKQPQDMVRALEQEVGVLVQQTARGQASPFVRGLTGQQVLILIDGVRLNNSTFRAGPNQYFNTIDPGQVERIEVLRGPQSALWGSDALGGVINIVTRSPSWDRGPYSGSSFREIFSTADTASYSRANIEGWAESSGVFAGASYLNVNELDRGGDLGRQPFTDYDQYAGDVKYNLLLDEDHLLTVALQHFEQQDVPRSDRFPPFVFGPPVNTPRPTYFDPQQRDLAYIRLQGLSGSSLFDAYTMTASYHRQKEGTREERSPTRTDVGEFDVNTGGYTLVLAKDLDQIGHLTYGVDYYDDELDAFRNNVNPVTGTSTPSDPQFPDDSRYDRLGVFLNLDREVTERLDALVGMRYENVDASGTLRAVSGPAQPFERTYQDWIGSIGLTYEINPCLNLVGGVSEGFRAPNLDDLAADNPALQNAQDIPSLDVDPEHAINYEIGVKMDYERLRFQAFEFWTDLEDNIGRQAVDALGNPVPNVPGPNGVPVPGSNTFIRDNFDAYVNGTELAGELLLEDGWSLYGNFWYIYGKDLERDEPLSRIPPTQGILGLRWRERCNRRWFDVYTWMVRRQDRYAVQNNTDSRFPVGGTPGYATLNVRMGRSWGECDCHRLSLNLENITDKAYRVLGSGVDAPGINMIVGYELSY